MNPNRAVSERFIRNVRDVAEGKVESLELDTRDARKLLDYLEIDWVPDIPKGEDQKQALGFFKEGLREKFGQRAVRFSTSTGEIELADGTLWEEDFLTVCFSGKAKSWECMSECEDALYALWETSGLSRYFVGHEECFINACGDCVIVLRSKKSRKVKE